MKKSDITIHPSYCDSSARSQMLIYPMPYETASTSSLPSISIRCRPWAIQSTWQMDGEGLHSAHDGR
ncbi:MAG: hypothetical protein R2788_16565 [Saprospiraceae bacterium]